MKPPSYWPRILRELRIEQGMTQRGLAARAGVSRSTVIAAERGDKITVRTAERILDVLGYELDALKREAPPCP